MLPQGVPAAARLLDHLTRRIPAIPARSGRQARFALAAQSCECSTRRHPRVYCS